MKKIRPFISTFYKKNYGQSVEKMKMDMVRFYFADYQAFIKGLQEQFKLYAENFPIWSN